MGKEDGESVVKYLLIGLIVLIVLGVILLPAFGPPTSSLLVVARLSWHLRPVALVAIGVVAAGAGRFLLAHAAPVARPVFGTLPGESRID